MSELFPLKQSVTEGFSCQQVQRSSSFLLVGGHQTCKTSLLFRWALTLTQQERDQVVFISPRFLDRLPCQVHGMPQPTIASLDLLTIVYIRSFDELVQYLSNLHKQSLLPTAFVVDDFNHLVNKRSQKLGHTSGEHSERALMAKLSSLLIETGNFCARKKRKKFTVVAAYNSEFVESLANETVSMAESVGKMMFDLVLTVEKTEDLCHKNFFKLKYPKDLISNFAIYFYLEQNDIIADRMSVCFE